MLAENARSELAVLLAVLGFAPQQIGGLLAHGVTIDQLRGMWQLRQCEGAPAELLAEMAAQIDRLEEFEKLPLDAHTA